MAIDVYIVKYKLYNKDKTEWNQMEIYRDMRKLFNYF